MFDLDRFKTAQASPTAGFALARQELAAGRKHGHWIWYVFPQLAGLGRSAASVHYGLQGVEEATAYVRDPLLGERLRTVARSVADHLRREPPPALSDLMGSDIDAQKLVSSMTLFREVARRARAELADDEAGEPSRPGDSRAESSAVYADIADSAETILQAAAREGLPPCAFTLTRLAR
jgi:uncharacterized protein (DUF1810 family)